MSSCAKELPSGELVRVAVECKHHSNNIGIRSVERFASVVKTLRLAGEVETGTMVSLTGYGDRANALAIKARHSISSRLMICGIDSTSCAPWLRREWRMNQQSHT